MGRVEELQGEIGGSGGLEDTRHLGSGGSAGARTETMAGRTGAVQINTSRDYRVRVPGRD